MKDKTPPHPRRFRRCLKYGFFIYLLIALPGLATSKHEIFPFFAWTLFPVTPGKVVSFQLRIPPDETYFIPRAGAGNPIDFYNAVQRLGAALQAENAQVIRAERLFLESNYLPPESPYEILEIRMDPGEYYKSGVSEIRRIETFPTRSTADSDSP